MSLMADMSPCLVLLGHAFRSAASHKLAVRVFRTCMQGSHESFDAWLPKSAQDVLKAMLMEPAELAGKMQSPASTDVSGAYADELSPSTGASPQ